MSVELVGLVLVLSLAVLVLALVVALGTAAVRLVDRLLRPDEHRAPREPYLDPSAETVPTVVCVTCHTRYPAGDVHECAQGPDIQSERLVA